MASEDTEDEILAFDLKHRAYLLCIDALKEALHQLYKILWQLADGNEQDADSWYTVLHNKAIEEIRNMDLPELSEETKTQILKDIQNNDSN